MNLILCVDEGGGMSFLGRRQSMDRVLRQKALALAGEGKLWMDGYTAGQFREEIEGIRVTGDPLHEIPEDGWFFLELGDVEAFLANAKRLALFRWNRLYPADRRFPLETLETPVHREDFPGNSHDSITLEVYAL